MERMKDAGPGMSIAAVAQMLDVPVPTIRSWERRYGLPVPRTRGGHRRYDREHVARLRALRDEIVRGHRPNEAAARVRAAADQDRGAGYVERILEAADAWDGEAIRGALDASTASMRVEEAIETVAFASLREIGSRWETGRCDVGQEHIVTSEVRAWLMRHRTLAPPPYRGGEPLVLACGPDGEHSVGLEAFALVLARRGWPLQVLGARTPTASLLEAARATKARGVVVTCHWTAARKRAIAAIRAAESQPGGAPVFYAGGVFTAARARRGVPGVYLGEQLEPAADLIEETVAGDKGGR